MSPAFAWTVCGVGVVCWVLAVISLLASRRYMDVADEYVEAGKKWWDESHEMLREAHRLVDSDGEGWKP